MKVFLLIAALACTPIAALRAPSSDVKVLFSAWKTQHQRDYDTAEDHHRLGLFSDKLLHVRATNARYRAGNSTWWAGLNQFSDWDLMIKAAQT